MLSQTTLPDFSSAGPAWSGHAREWWLKGLLIALCAVLCGVGTGLPSARADSLRERLLSVWDPRSSPFIPLPEVATDPNAGTSVGALPIFLGTDDDHRIRRIIAPDLLYNSDLGWGTHYRHYAYPSDDSQWYFIAGLRQRVERDLELDYDTGLERNRRWSWSAHLLYEKSATPRFFGIGNDTPERDHSNYTATTARAGLRAGWNLSRHWQWSFQLLPRYVEVGHGTLHRVPSIEQRFPGANLLSAQQELEWRTTLHYDTRDSTIIPTRGVDLVLYAGGARRGVLSDFSTAQLGFEARLYQPLHEGLILAAHTALQYQTADAHLPFWALSGLGGERNVEGTQQALRGYGDRRFVDRNVFAAHLELRWRVFDLNLFSTVVGFEAAPFIDLGSVFHTAEQSPFERLHAAAGVGFRAIAAPYVVGRVDVGYGSEGLAIYSGIGYPF